MNKEMLKKKLYAAVKEVNIAIASQSAPVYSHEVYTDVKEKSVSY